MAISTDEVGRALELLLKKVTKEKEHLSDLDSITGDGDHGINMERGVAAAWSRVGHRTYDDMGTMMREIALNFMDAAGGYFGPLLGIFYLKMAERLAGKSTVQVDEYAAAMTEALGSLKRLGHAELGDKTMLDAMEPGVRALAGNAHRSDEDALVAAAEAARAGMEGTKTMPHKLGRPPHEPERVTSTIDPGALSISMIFDAMRDTRIPPAASDD